MDVCVQDFKDVRVRRETFFDYCGVPDPNKLSCFGFFHIGGQLLCCAYCNKEFITWNKSEEFFWKHRERNCTYHNDDYNFCGNDLHDQTVDIWMTRPFVKAILDSHLFDDDEMRNALKDYLKKKGNFASVRTLKDYLKNYSQNIKYVQSNIEI